MAEEVKLFKTWSSPFGLRIVWALKLKGIKYEYSDEDLANKSPLLLQYNPVHKKIPVLVHNEKPICESLVILEYIEETWKENPMLPQHPYERANARFWAKLVDEKVMPSIWVAFIEDGEQHEEAIKQIAENLKLFEDELKVKGTKYFGGDVIGFVDIALGWLAYLIPVFEGATGSEICNEHEFPLLSTWMQQFVDAQIIKGTLPPHDKLVTKFKALREMVKPTKAPSMVKLSKCQGI